MDKKMLGLENAQVEESKLKYGINKLPEQEPETFWDKFKGNLDDPMLKLLMIIAGIMIVMFCFGQAEIYEPIGTIVAIILVATIGARTEMSSDAAYRKLKNSTKKDTCKVYRNGVVTVIDIDDVVVGDIVLLQSGDKIPADGILIEGDLRVNNSALNGETEECKKFAATKDFEMPEEITGDTFVDKHSLFRGAVIYNGEGLMEVKRVGIGNPEAGYPGTMMGKMAEEMNVEEPDSPLKVKLAKLADQISTFGYIGAIALAIAYMIHFVMVAGGVKNYIKDFHIVSGSEVFILVGLSVIVAVLALIIPNIPNIKNKEKLEFNWKLPIFSFCVVAFLVLVYFGSVPIFKDIIKAAQLAIVIIVCAVPEGLPLMISIVLMSNTGEMLKHNVLVRKAIGIETAGSLNTLFSDKTGTITKGVLEVVEFLNGSGTTMDIRNTDCKIRDYLNLAIGKNTGAMFDSRHQIVGGNMTDKALMEFLTEDIFNKLKNDKNCIITKQQGFNSTNKFSSSYIKSLGKTFYKGAPEKLLEKATKYIDKDGTIKELNKEVLNEKLTELAKRAMRLLAFGYSEKELVDDVINDDLVLIGLVAIRDDVRPEAIEAIKEVQGAGVHVCMITGDRKETAFAIAKESGLISSEDDIVLTSEELNKMSDDEIKNIFTKIKCIARALPTDKSRMVRIGQSLNRVCGMTGDGVNDSPALKSSDVGFSMGLSGTDAAKEASDLVITDDNFRSIKDALLFGRTIYLNILKFVRFQLTINVAAVLVSAILPFLGFESPLGVTQMLFLNLVMDSLGALLLGKEPARESYMKHPPKRRDESIITKNIFIQFVTMGLYVTILSILWFEIPFFRSFFDTEMQFRTGYFAFFIFISIFNGFNVRTDGFGIFKDLDKNENFMKVWLAMLCVTVVLCMIDIIPFCGFIGEMFETTYFGLKGWLLVVVMAITIIPVDMLRKAIFQTQKNE